MTATARIFKNGQNQAIRLPKDLEFDGVKEVSIRKEGQSLIITPVKKSWTSFAHTTPQADDDFLDQRPDVFEDDRHRVSPAPNVNAVAARVHVGVHVTQRDARLL